MSGQKEWPKTTTIPEINGIKRPNVTKNVWAISTTKFGCEFFKWDINKIEATQIAPFINAIGNIHGPAPKDRPGIDYAKMAIEMLTGKGNSHLPSPQKWFPQNNDNINKCKPFLNEIFKLLGAKPDHSPELPANQILLEKIKNDFSQTKQSKQEAIYFNGIFEGVMEEILKAMKKRPEEIYFVQPYSPKIVQYLAKNTPTMEQPLTAYFSVTTSLNQVAYTAEIVGWENKLDLTDERRDEVEDLITKHQPKEEGCYMEERGTPCVNLISIINLKKITNPFPVGNLIKISNNIPLQHRSRSGNWSYVYAVPEWVGLKETVLKEIYDQENEEKIQESEKLDDSVRQKRLAEAPKKPEQVQIVSKGFKRNQDVIVAVLQRAKGICEHCGHLAPFTRKKDDSPYLEVHHWVLLSNNGDDTVENAAALCPNCHKGFHYGDFKRKTGKKKSKL